MTHEKRPFSKPHVLILGGGSGGHISPGLAVAETHTHRGARCSFLCSERPVDSRMLTAAGVDFQTVPAAPLNMRPTRLVRCLNGIRLSSRHARKFMETARVDTVLALGGFVAAATVMGARSAQRSSRKRGQAHMRGPIVLLNLDRIP